MLHFSKPFETTQVIGPCSDKYVEPSHPPRQDLEGVSGVPAVVGGQALQAEKQQSGGGPNGNGPAAATARTGTKPLEGDEAASPYPVKVIADFLLTWRDLKRTHFWAQSFRPNLHPHSPGVDCCSDTVKTKLCASMLCLLMKYTAKPWGFCIEIRWAV